MLVAKHRLPEETMSTSRSKGEEESVRPKRPINRKQERAGEALDKKSLSFCDKNGIISYCSALNTRFCPTIIFRRYEAAKIVADNERVQRDEISKWLSVTSQFESSLQTFLLLPYHKFWVIVHSEISVQVALDSYLRNGPRFHDVQAVAALQTDQMKHLANNVHALVLKILIRVTTDRESERDFLTPHALDCMLSRAFDLPKLMDIASLFWPTAGDQTRRSIRHLVRRVMLANSKHDSQLTDLMSGVINLMELMKRKLFLGDDGADDAKMEKNVPLNHQSCRSISSSQLKTMSWSEFQEILNTVTDMAVSVCCFMEAFPPALQAFHDNNFESAFINFYELVFPVLQLEFDRRLNQQRGCSISRFAKQVIIARSYVIHSCRQVIHYSSIRPLHDPTVDHGIKPVLFDSLLDVVTLILSNKYFAKDYYSKYPLSADIEHLRSNSSITGFSDVERSRIDYLLQECHNIESVANASRGSSSYNMLSNNVNGNISGGAAPAVAAAGNQKKNRKTKKEKTAGPDVEREQVSVNSAGGGIQEVELLSLITGVRDILPDFGEGFIEACLEKFAFNQELALNALLTDDLPPEIRSIDKKLTRDEKKRLQQSAEDEENKKVTPVLPDVIATRSNIYDGDEFDIHRNDKIDLSRVHVGKKDRASQSVSDAAERESLRQRTLLLQERILQDEEEEELKLLAEMGITDPADLYVG